jgi:galactokinase/mevalonate kinase-like predicted kinase
MEFYGVEIAREAQPTFVLLVEQEELGITVGLQDRVIQVYEGLVYMDFDVGREHVVDGLRCYAYEPLDPALLPPIYVAYHETLGEPTEIFHNNIRERFRSGDRAVVDAMACLAGLAAQGREALLDGDAARLSRLIDWNFDTRRGIYRLPAWQIEMVETARACGASAKFAGSGGAIVGTFDGDAMFESVSRRLAAIGSRTIRPDVAPTVLR